MALRKTCRPGGAVDKNPLANAGLWVLSLVREDPTCHGATKPMCHNYWACALQPTSCNYWNHHTLESEVANKRSHQSEKPMHHNTDTQHRLTWLEKNHSQQQRPSATRKKTGYVHAFIPRTCDCDHVVLADLGNSMGSRSDAKCPYLRHGGGEGGHLKMGQGWSNAAVRKDHLKKKERKKRKHCLDIRGWKRLGQIFPTALRRNTSYQNTDFWSPELWANKSVKSVSV